MTYQDTQINLVITDQGDCPILDPQGSVWLTGSLWSNRYKAQGQQCARSKRECRSQAEGKLNQGYEDFGFFCLFFTMLQMGFLWPCSRDGAKCGGLCSRNKQ